MPQPGLFLAGIIAGHRERVLRETLRLWRRTSHIYGQSDCLLSVADYGRALTCIDIGAPWRGTYTSEAEASRIVKDAGGAVPLLGGALVAGKFFPTEAPARGDPIVAHLLGKDFGGVWLGEGRAAFRLERGLLELKLRDSAVVGAWTCPQPVSF